MSDTGGNAAAPVASWRKCRRGSFMATTPLQPSLKDSTSQHDNRPPQCNISNRLMPAWVASGKDQIEQIFSDSPPISDGRVPTFGRAPDALRARRHVEM